MPAKPALVKIEARDPIAAESGVANAAKRARNVDAESVLIAVMREAAFIHVDTSGGRGANSVTCLAAAGVGTRGIDAAGRVGVTSVDAKGALLDVSADDAVTSEASVTGAHEAARGIEASALAGVGASSALINIRAGDPIAGVAGHAAAGKASWGC